MRVDVALTFHRSRKLWPLKHADADAVYATGAGVPDRNAPGRAEWVCCWATSVGMTSFGWISKEEYDDFAEAYGFDVTTWEGFELLRDIREMRMTCMAVQTAAETPSYAPQAQHRLDCLRGRLGFRPWRGWTPIP
ncbi:hypothetical protein [Nocardia exalbida]|uniref:hypothetical protein n=1 Tax=Nocardia exalbida TaxID=290231 RepID=UPI0012F6959C|nr:hypothetical protein [Nocardia exalbida]